MIYTWIRTSGLVRESEKNDLEGEQYICVYPTKAKLTHIPMQSDRTARKRLSPDVA